MVVHQTVSWLDLELPKTHASWKVCNSIFLTGLIEGEDPLPQWAEPINSIPDMRRSKGLWSICLHVGAQRSEFVLSWLKVKRIQTHSSSFKVIWQDAWFGVWLQDALPKEYFVLGCGYLMFRDLWRKLVCSLHYGKEAFCLPPSFGFEYGRTLINKLRGGSQYSVDALPILSAVSSLFLLYPHPFLQVWMSKLGITQDLQSLQMNVSTLFLLLPSFAKLKLIFLSLSQWTQDTWFLH